MESSVEPSALHQVPSTSQLRREDPELGWGTSQELCGLQHRGLPGCTHHLLMEGGLGRKPVHTIMDFIREQRRNQWAESHSAWHLAPFINASWLNVQSPSGTSMCPPIPVLHIHKLRTDNVFLKLSPFLFFRLSYHKTFDNSMESV